MVNILSRHDIIHVKGLRTGTHSEPPKVQIQYREINICCFFDLIPTASNFTPTPIKHMMSMPGSTGQSTTLSVAKKITKASTSVTKSAFGIAITRDHLGLVRWNNEFLIFRQHAFVNSISLWYMHACFYERYMLFGIESVDSIFLFSFRDYLHRVFMKSGLSSLAIFEMK